MPCVLLVSCLMNFICYVQVFQDIGVYGSNASQLLDLGASEFAYVPKLTFKSRVCLGVLSWNSQRGRS